MLTNWEVLRRNTHTHTQHSPKYVNLSRSRFLKNMQMSRSFILRIGTDSFYANEVDSFIEWTVFDGFRWNFQVKMVNMMIFDGILKSKMVEEWFFDGFR